MRPSEILQEKLPEVKKIMEENEYFTNLRVFGSVANGTDTEGSDIDFLVDAKKNHGLLAHIGLKHELEELLGVEVDLAEEKSLRGYVKKSINNILVI